MNLIIETILGIVLIFIIQKILNRILQVVFLPLTVPYLNYIVREKGDEMLAKKLFRLDFFINNIVGYFMTVFSVKYLLKLLPWNYTRGGKYYLNNNRKRVYIHK